MIVRCLECPFYRLGDRPRSHYRLPENIALEPAPETAQFFRGEDAAWAKSHGCCSAAKPNPEEVNRRRAGFYLIRWERRACLWPGRLDNTQQTEVDDLIIGRQQSPQSVETRTSFLALDPLL